MLNSLQSILGIKIKNENLYIEALTHSSFANENNTKSYERLEFLGDSILEFVVRDYLLVRFSDKPEGDLTKVKIKLVQEKTLADIIYNIKINELIRVGKSLSNVNQSICGDIFESIIGAIYLDLGFNSAKKFIYKFLIKNIDDILSTSFDYKSPLQEFLQAKGKQCRYNVLNKEKENIVVELIIDEQVVAVQKGCSIKDAEQKCAKIAFNALNK